MAGNLGRRVAGDLGADTEVGDKTRTTITSTIHKEVLNPDEVERANLTAVDWPSQPQRLYTSVNGQWIFLTRLPHRLAPEELETRHGRSTYRQIPLCLNNAGREIEHEEFMRVDHVGPPTPQPQMSTPVTSDSSASIAALMQQLLPVLIGARQTQPESASDVMHRQMSEQAKIEQQRLEREEKREEDRRLREEKREQIEREREDRREEKMRQDRAAYLANKQAMITAAISALPVILAALRPPTSTAPDPAVASMLGLIESSAKQTERILISMAERRDSPRDRSQEQLVTFLTTQLQNAQQQAMQLLTQPKAERPEIDPMVQLFNQMRLMEKMRNMFSDDAPEEDDDLDPMMQAGLLALVGQAKPEMLPMLQSVLAKRRGRDDDDDGDDDNVSVRADRLFARVAQDPALATEVQRRLMGDEQAPPPVQHVQRPPAPALAQAPELAQDETLSILDAVRRRQQQKTSQ